MPIYMDRHDLPGVTAKDVAKAHQEDLKIQDQYGCRAITYWFDEERQTAFCLIEAPDKGAVKAMHEHAHGLIPHQIIEVNNQVVESFLGRIEDRHVEDQKEPFIENESAFRSILATNIKYSKGKHQCLNKQEFILSQRRHHAIVSKMIERYKGRIAEYNEQCTLCSFVSASQAFTCAIEIRNSFVGNNRQNDKPVSVQLGICAGSPIAQSGDFFGNTIQQARNMCYMSERNQITMSSGVADHCRKNNISSFEKENVVILKRSEESFIEQLFHTMEKSCKKEGFKLDKLATELGVSKSQLYRKIVALMHLSPNDFIKEYRLSKALKMMEKQECSISEIAYETGFSSPSYFSKCFKERFGILPSLFINACESGEE
ncbi:nickel-binding protein [Carboxylicivirga sp. RSCT41]|uniref:nickel-binding protein n=1 Tax=Carboxylicivirga agarovorans TaxID=3417570 RepID=UPI003D33D7FC